MELAVGKRKLGPPGVRFHPYDSELVMDYLLRKVLGEPLEPGYVADAEIYKFHPADLKAQACFREELNWYFFCTTGNKYGSGERKNRTTPRGFWKPTGNDRVVLHKRRAVGKIKTLVFHEGKPANGKRTNWVMHEYRLVGGELASKGKSDAFVLCKLFKKKAVGPRNGEQFGPAYEEELEIEEGNNELESVAVQSASAVMTENVFSGVVSQSEICLPPTPTSNAANVASTSHGFTFNANPFKEKPLAGSDIPSSSMGPVPDQTDEVFYLADLDLDVSGNPDYVANVASTSHGITLNPNPLPENPVAGSDIPSSSMVPVPDQNEEKIYLADLAVDLFGNLNNVANVDSTSHGVTLNANTFQENPIVGPPDQNDEIVTDLDAEVFGNLGNLPGTFWWNFDYNFYS